MRDLITEISRACRGDANSMDYLAGLSPQDWAAHPYALGQFLQEGELHDPDWLQRFASIFVMVMEHHGRGVLTEYLTSSFGPSRSAAIQVLVEIGSPDGDWAVGFMEETAEDTEMPLYVRNAAASGAAKIAGRPPPDPIEPEAIPVTVEALRAALEELEFGDTDATQAVTVCATALADEAIPVFEEFIPRWIEQQIAPWSIKSIGGGCPPFREALMNLLEAGENEKPWQLAGVSLARHVEYEDRLDVLLREATDPTEIEQIADAIAHVTREIGVSYLNDKDYRSRAYGAEVISKLEPRHVVRQAAGIVDGIAGLQNAQGWVDECEMAAAALVRADAEQVADVLAEYFRSGLRDDGYWRARPFYNNETLRRFVEQMADSDAWARETLERLDEGS